MLSAVSFSPLGLAQINAAEQRSQLLRGDLTARFSSLGKGHRVRAFLQTLGPYREAVTIPIQDLDPVTGSNEILHTDWAS